MLGRIWALFGWAMLCWLLLTWTFMTEQLVAGGLIAAVGACCLAPLGEVAPPWKLLAPKVLLQSARILAVGLAKIARANLSLAARIWAPSRPLQSGMVIVPTTMRTDAGIAGVGLITSLIVDNQITDLDRERSELQFHTVSVQPSTDAQIAAVNGPIEELIAPLVSRPAEGRP